MNSCLIQKVSGAKVEQLCFPGSVLGRALGCSCHRLCFSVGRVETGQVKPLAGVAELGQCRLHC